MNEEKTSNCDLRGLNIGFRLLYLILTYRCTSECSHCFASSSTSKNDPMKLHEIQEYLEKAKELGAKPIWLLGGEPFLYFDLLLDAVESVKNLGLSIWTTSNAFWTTSEKTALRWLRPP